MAGVPDYHQLRSVGGWFGRGDHAAFQAVNDLQADLSGDLLEIGAFEGRSAIVLAGLLRGAEALHVCDPFGSGEGDDANRRENRREYASLTRATFDANFARFHDHPPVVHQCLSSDLRVDDNSFRFVHIDGSHLYENAVLDAQVARRALTEDGLVVFDDYRKLEGPGVAAAIWRTDGLTPVLLTKTKLYGSWNPDRYGSIADAARARGCAVTEVPFGSRSVAIAEVDPPLVKAINAVLRRSARLRRSVGL